MTELRKIVVAKAMGAKTKPEGSIDEVITETEHMSAIDKAMETAKKLAGTEVIVESMKEKDKKMEALRKEKEETNKELQATQLQLIQSQLGSKIEQLSELVKGGASPKTISQQINEIKSAATELGLGSSKISEFKEVADLIQKFNPQKSLADQLKDAKEVMALLQPERKGATIEGMPAEIVLQIKKIDAELQIKLEELRDDRQRRDQDFKLTLLKFEENRDIRRQEVDGKILVERERNELIAGAIKTVGSSIGQGLRDGVKSQPGVTSRGPQTGGKVYQFQMPEGGFGTTECPNCRAPIEIGPTTTLAECLECHTQYPVNRTPAVKNAATLPIEEE